jgi:hypothetical protein
LGSFRTRLHFHLPSRTMFRQPRLQGISIYTSFLLFVA